MEAQVVSPFNLTRQELQRLKKTFHLVDREMKLMRRACKEDLTLLKKCVASETESVFKNAENCILALLQKGREAIMHERGNVKEESLRVKEAAAEEARRKIKEARKSAEAEKRRIVEEAEAREQDLC